jgi:hypothetical protein
VGPLIGWFATRRDFKAKQKQEALNRLQNILGDTVRLAKRQAEQQFQAIAPEFERVARTTFSNAAVETQKELERKLAAIEEARKRARQENDSRAAYFKQRLEQTDSLLRAIGQLAGAGVPEPQQG